MKYRKEDEFISCFHRETGFYFRTGIIRDGKKTQEDPFMASFPELLDVGVMGHCKHGRTGLCLQSGTECYQNGLTKNDPNMSLKDFQRIVAECKGNTYQIALGGCGDPDQHEEFEELLKTCVEAEIVPNFTTSGLGMTRELAGICKEYCGAVAVSWYRNAYTYDAISMLMEAGVKTNIHFVLMKDTIQEAIELLSCDRFPKGINAVIFLLHKPVGLGSREQILHTDNPDLEVFLSCIENTDFKFKIGFDSCTVPALIKNCTIRPNCIDTCEGGRWSAYISSDMKMMPCSFDNQGQRWSVDLRRHTIQEAWFSKEFHDFRNHLRHSCPDCEHRTDCMGGCPICPEIVLCSEAERRGG